MLEQETVWCSSHIADFVCHYSTVTSDRAGGCVCDRLFNAVGFFFRAGKAVLAGYHRVISKVECTA